MESPYFQFEFPASFENFGKKELGFGRIRTPDLPLARVVLYLKTNEASMINSSRNRQFEYIRREIQIENNELAKWSFLMGKFKMAALQLRCQSL